MYQTFRWRGQVIDVTGLTWKWPYKAVLIVCFVFFWPASYNITLLPLFSMDKRIRATHQCQRASPSSIINVFFCSVFPLYTQNAVHLASAIITKELITNSYITNDTDTFDYYLFHHLSLLYSLAAEAKQNWISLDRIWQPDLFFLKERRMGLIRESKTFSLKHSTSASFWLLKHETMGGCFF